MYKSLHGYRQLRTQINLDFFFFHKKKYKKVFSLDTWYNYFNKLFNPVSEAVSIHYALPYFEDSLLDVEFSLFELNCILHKAKHKKAPGFDGIPNEFFINSSDYFKL